MELRAPELIKKYVENEKSLTPFMKVFSFNHKGEHGKIYQCEAYKGVQVWVCDFEMKELPMQCIEEYHYLKINYCIAGRCEIRLMDSRYIYLAEDHVSIDLNQIKGSVIMPTGKYLGLEIVIDLEAISKEYPAAWRECGINLEESQLALNQLNGSFLASASPYLKANAQALIDAIKGEKIKVSECRFLLLNLLHMFNDGKQLIGLNKKCYLTRGQKEIVNRVELKMVGNLACRYPITKLADNEGMSASTLKKYFVLVYGKTISDYLLEKRLEKAKKMLIDTKENIVEIAAAVGYENPGKFSVKFRQKVGITPIEYRRLNRQKFKQEATEAML